MEPATQETVSPPDALKQLQLLGVDAEGAMVFRRGKPKSNPISNPDAMQEGLENRDDKELSQNDIDTKMMPPPAPRTSPPSSSAANATSANQPASSGEPPKTWLLNELSENAEDHDDGCLFMVWINRRKTLMTDEEVRSAFVENVSTIKNKTRRELALRKMPKALEEDGHVMEYLKSQREYYESLKEHFVGLCDCYEECSD